MAKQIWRYHFDIGKDKAEFALLTPYQAISSIVNFAVYGDRFTLWVESYNNIKCTNRYFKVYPDYQDIRGSYIKSCIHGAKVWHLYELSKEDYFSESIG